RTRCSTPSIISTTRKTPASSPSPPERHDPSPRCQRADRPRRLQPSPPGGRPPFFPRVRHRRWLGHLPADGKRLPPRFGGSPLSRRTRFPEEGATAAPFPAGRARPPVLAG